MSLDRVSYLERWELLGGDDEEPVRVLLTTSDDEAVVVVVASDEGEWLQRALHPTYARRVIPFLINLSHAALQVELREHGEGVKAWFQGANTFGAFEEPGSIAIGLLLARVAPVPIVIQQSLLGRREIGETRIAAP